jgi:hypothetical protein
VTASPAGPRSTATIRTTEREIRVPGRFEFERAIRRSGLPPLSRLLALTIATWASAESGVIPTEHQPAQSVLLEATGLSKSAFLNHREVLVQAGWISYTSPDPEKARREHAQNEYFIHIPARSPGDPAPTKARSAGDRAKTGKTAQTKTRARSADDPAFKGAGSADDLELGRLATQKLGRQATTRVPSQSHESRDDAPVTAQTIVGEWLERVAKRPPASVVGQVAKQTASLLDEGIDPNDVRRGLALWMHKGLHPSVIPSVVNEAMNANPAAARQPAQTTYTPPVF